MRADRTPCTATRGLHETAGGRFCAWHDPDPDVRRTKLKGRNWEPPVDAIRSPDDALVLAASAAIAVAAGTLDHRAAAVIAKLCQEYRVAYEKARVSARVEEHLKRAGL